MRRFYAFFIMVLSIIAVVVFNAQAQYGLMNFGLEYQSGTEYTYVITPDDASRFDINKVAQDFADRLENAGAKDYYVYAKDDSDRVATQDEASYEITVRLSGLESQQKNVLRNIENYGKFWLTNQGDLRTDEGEDIERGSAKVIYNGSSASVVVKTTDAFKENVGNKLTSSSSDGEDSTEGDKIVLWAYDFDEINDSYSEAIKDETIEQKNMQKKVVAVLESSAFNKDNNELTINAIGYVSNGTSTQGLNSTSAHSLQRMLNDKLLDYSIERLYTNSINANYGNISPILVCVACIVLVLIACILLISTFGINGVAGSASLILSSFLTLVFYNSFNLTISPAFAISFIASVALGSVILSSYFSRFKNDLYKGRLPSKANKDSFKATVSTAIDASLFTLIASIVLALISKNAVQNFFIFIIISVIFNFIICLFLTRIMLYFVANSKVGEKLKLYRVKTELIPDLAKSEEQKYFGKFANYDATKHQKKSLISLLSLSVISLVAVLVFSVIPSTSTFAYSNEFNSYTVVQIVDTKGDTLTTNESVKEFFKETINVEPFEVFIADEIDKNDIEGEDKVYYINAKFNLSLQDLDNHVEKIEEVLTNEYNFEFDIVSADETVDSISYFTVSPYASTHSFNNSIVLILITLVCTIIYCFVRFRYTFSLASIVTILGSTLVTVGILALSRIPVSPNLGIALLASVLVTTILEFIVLERYGQIKKENKSKVVLKEDRLEFIKKALAQSMSSLITVTASVVLGSIVMMFISPLQMYSLYLITILGTLIGLLAIIFVFVPVYNFSELHLSFKAKKKKSKEKKVKKGNKVTRTSMEVEEVIIPGIND